MQQNCLKFLRKGTIGQQMCLVHFRTGLPKSLRRFFNSHYSNGWWSFPSIPNQGEGSNVHVSNQACQIVGRRSVVTT